MNPSPAPQQPDFDGPVPAAKPGLLTREGTNVTIDQAAAEKAFGSSDEDFLTAFVGQLVNLGSSGKKTPDDKGTAFVVSVIRGVEPKDQLEAMLASQMAAVHLATMTFARRLAQVETIPQQDSAERAFNKLARTFAAQLEALKRYRTGGQQQVTVKHVTVNDGGQAIVGPVTHGGRGNGQK